MNLSSLESNIDELNSPRIIFGAPYYSTTGLEQEVVGEVITFNVHTIQVVVTEHGLNEKHVV